MATKEQIERVATACSVYIRPQFQAAEAVRVILAVYEEVQAMEPGKSGEMSMATGEQSRDKTCEMRYNDLALRQQLMDIVESYNPKEPFLPDGNLRVMNELMAALSPYLRTSEPVSLEPCIAALADYAEGLPELSPTKLLLRSRRKEVSKAVLDAAGVKYVD